MIALSKCKSNVADSCDNRVEKILLVLRPMEGVAYTFGSEIYKEIHFSLDYIAGAKARATDEIKGVLTHEMVHCFQHTGKGVAFPGGLGEGIAGALSFPQSSCHGLS